jgi:TRAP-type C4-dicarboxylate transport system permease small subunit
MEVYMEEKKIPWYDKIEKSVIIVLFTCMVAIIGFTVFSRYIFGYTPSWAEQASRIMFIWISFAGVSWAGATGAHLRVTAVTMFAGEKVSKIFLLIGDLITMGFGLFIAYKMLFIIQTVVEKGQTFASMQWLPAWILYVPAVAGMIGLPARIIQTRYRAYKQAKNEAVEGGSN